MRAKELFDTSVEQVARGDVRGALATLLSAVAEDPGHGPSLEAAGRVCRVLGAPDDASLFETLAEHPDHADALFALAYRLVDQRRPDVAVPLLARALAATPKDHALRRELAYAELLDGRFDECLTTLAPLRNEPELAEPEQLDVYLLSAEAALVSGRRELASAALDLADHLVPDDTQRARLDALHAQLGRAAHFEALKGAGLRPWHFIQHAGMLLKVAGGWMEDGSRGGRYEHLALRPDMVAFLLQRFCDVAADFELSFDVVLPASQVAAPLAHALAGRLGCDVGDDLADRQGRAALLVASNAAEFTPFLSGLAAHKPDLRLFSLNLDWSRPAPLCPEVVGVLAQRVLLPWEERYALDPNQPQELRQQARDTRGVVELATDLIAAMDALPDDGGKARDEFLEIYRPLAGELILGNDELHPFRRQFTQVSPAWASTSLRPEGSEDDGDDPDDEGWVG